MTQRLRRLGAVAAAGLGFALMPALAQESSAPEPPAAAAPPAIAVPAMATPIDVPTPAGSTAALSKEVAVAIAADLGFTGKFSLLGPDGLPAYGYPQVTRPAFPGWRNAGARHLVAGFVEARPDGQITVGCYLHDVTGGREQARQGFVVSPENWRRAAHKCADTVYSRLTGEPGFLDSRVAYVAESGPANARQTRIAIMDLDGSDPRYLTTSGTTVLTPRFSPDGSRLAVVSYVGGRPATYLLDLASGRQNPLVPGPAMTSAPSFSPDGKRVAFALSEAGNTDIYVVAANGGTPVRLTVAPGIDTSPSFSSDGSRIAFESDRGGTQQLYVMNADGSGQRRISFGGGAYGSPVWSPRGDLLAFVRVGGPMRVGVMNADGGGERMVTYGDADEAPSWAPNGRFILFSRGGPAGQSGLFAVPANGGPATRLQTLGGSSDPSWSPLQP